jgi:hypothetical protein
VPEFRLAAIQHLKGPAQRPLLNLLKLSPPVRQVGVTISGNATKNMSCSGGVCTPTATVAVLNVSQLTRMLVDQSVTIGTSAQAPDIFVNAPFSWTSANGLTLQAIGNILVNKPVSDAGPAPLSISYNANGAGGVLSFGSRGHISFLSAGNALTINGQNYILADNIQLLAQLIAREPSGSFALSASYNARHDGKYSQSPIPTLFEGTFEGLGNTISALHIENSGSQPVGLFQQTAQSAVVENLVLNNAYVTQTSDENSIAGLLVGINSGVLLNVVISGQLVEHCGSDGDAGIITGRNWEGNIDYATAKGMIIAGPGCRRVGGLAGENDGANSFGFGILASKAYVAINADQYCDCGGAVGSNVNFAHIWTVLADGSVTALNNCDCGGLLGVQDIQQVQIVNDNISFGPVTAGASSYVGGFVGLDGADGAAFRDDGWCTTTSGITDPSQGAGNIPNDPEIFSFQC